MGQPVHQSSTLPQLKPPIPWGTGHSPPRAPQHGTIQADHHSWPCLLGPCFRGSQVSLITQGGTEGISIIAEAERALDFCLSPERWSEGGQTWSLKIQRHLRAFESQTWQACHLQKWDMGALECQQKWGRGCRLDRGFGHIPFCLPVPVSVHAHKIWCWCLKEAVVSHHSTCTRALTKSFCYCPGIWWACAHYWCKY